MGQGRMGESMSGPSCRRTHGRVSSFALIGLLLSALALAVAPGVAFAAGVVGTGTPASCTDAALGTALAGGGNVTFNCGANPVTIVVSVHDISSITSVDGGGKVTLSGNNANRIFCVRSGGSLSLANITLADSSGSPACGGVSGGGAVAVDSN